jgi:hypothetical protein
MTSSFTNIGTEREFPVSVSTQAKHTKNQKGSVIEELVVTILSAVCV